MTSPVATPDLSKPVYSCPNCQDAGMVGKLATFRGMDGQTRNVFAPQAICRCAAGMAWLGVLQAWPNQLQRMPTLRAQAEAKVLGDKIKPNL